MSKTKKEELTYRIVTENFHALYLVDASDAGG